MEPNTPMQTMPPQMGEPQKSNGALIGSVIVIIIIVLGGIYLFMQNKPKEAPVSNTLAEQSSGNDSSFDLQAVEQEIDNTDLETLDAEI